MDHILHVQVEHQSSAKHCDRGVARSAGAGADASRVTLALAAIAFLALFLSSFSMARATSQNSSTLPARLLAVAGSIFTSKTALFVLSNVIFILLAADCRCRFAATASAGDAASSGEPGGVLEKQAQHHHHHQVQVEQCAVPVLSSVLCSESLDGHGEQEGEDKSTMSDNASTLPDDEEQPSELELELRIGEEDGSTLDLEETVDDVEEPTCETAQGLDRLEISELNKKFDEFIRSRRVKWVKEEAYLLLCEV